MSFQSTAPPILTPRQESSLSVLPPSGSTSDVNLYVPQKLYSDPSSALYSSEFLSGAADQVSYVYQRLGGNVLDIELQPSNIYALYEQSVLEYSYLINMHQGRNSLSSFLGSPTASFDHDGNVTGDLSGTELELLYPKFTLSYYRRITDEIASEAGYNGSRNEYSASFDLISRQQDYDLQDIISKNPQFSNIVDDRRIEIKKVFYLSPRAVWRFYSHFGNFGGIGVMGNMHAQGLWSDGTQFDVVPVFQHKLQAQVYENSLYTRLSHFSFELKNNKLRLYPTPTDTWGMARKMWIRFTVPEGPYDASGDNPSMGERGVNNLNTLPFGNLPYDKINSAGKEWMRRFCFALCLETLGYVRSKLDQIPIPGNSVKLNGTELISRGKEEQDRLRKELQEQLDKTTYPEMIKQDAEQLEASQKISQKIPQKIYVK